jgi:hypothetical protein
MKFVPSDVVTSKSPIRTIALALSVFAAFGCSSEVTPTGGSSGATSNGGTSSSSGASGVSSSGSTSSSSGAFEAGASSSGTADAGGTGKAFGDTCTKDDDCESKACSVGGMGSYCSIRCTPANAAQVCVAPPSDGSCNNRGFCKKPGM